MKLKPTHLHPISIYEKKITRRQYLAFSAAAAAAAAAGTLPLKAAEQKKPIVPKRILGRTGVEIPIIGFGSGSRFCTAFEHRDEVGVETLHHAVDWGIAYFDTANGYGNGFAQSLMGRVLKTRRKEIFLASKIRAFTYDAIMRALEESLKRMQTDHVDLLHVHALGSDVDKYGGKDGVVDTYYKLREQKVARFIGVSAHHSPQPLRLFIERHDFDCVQMSLNAALQGMVKYPGGYKPDPKSPPSFESIVLPEAQRKNMGILAMKVLAQGHIVGKGPDKTDAQTLMRYAWSLPVASSMIGITSIAEVEQNAAWAAAFQPMPKGEMRALSMRLSSANKVALDRHFATHSDEC